MSNVQGGGIFLPHGSVPEKAIEHNMRQLRVQLAAQFMLSMAGERIVRSDGMQVVEDTIDQCADESVACADALLRHLSSGPFALPLKWKE